MQNDSQTLAVQETKMGNPEHKIMKNEGAVNLSPGVEDLDVGGLCPEMMAHF